MARVIAELITPGDARWTALLRHARHDVYHLPEYVIACARQDGGSAAAYYAESDGAALLAPLLIRDLHSDIGAPLGWKDAISPYGYAGPISTESDAASVRQLLAPFSEVAAQQHVVTTMLRLHPFRGIPTSALEGVGTVPDGIYEIISKQHEGWGYIKAAQ